MRDAESVLRDLRRISVDNHRCFGCGREHDCGLHGCAIIREAVDLICGLQGALSNSEEARSELGKRLAEAQQRLHEKTSEFDALLEGVHDCADVCVLCAYTDSNPDCNGECDNCEKPCACWQCDEKASNFLWKGPVKC